MNQHAVTKVLRIALGLLCLSPSHSFAQASAPYTWTGGSGSTAVDFEFRLDGSIIEEGSGSSTLSNADLEAATRFIWYPAQSALRAGGGLSTETVSDIGQYSVAFGDETRANGSDAVAISSNESSAILKYETT